jgi:hypothetical protein
MGGGGRLNEATKLVQLLLALHSSPLFGCVFACWVIIIVGSVRLLGYLCPNLVWQPLRTVWVKEL